MEQRPIFVPSEEAFFKALLAIIFVVFGIVLPTLAALCTCCLKARSDQRISDLEARVIKLEKKK